MNLTPRLELAARMLCGFENIADIGCDHGLLSAHLVQNGAKRAIACDLRPGPLAKAGETARRLGLESRIETRLCDGLNGVAPGEVQAVAICGMGGELIARIIGRAGWAAQGGHLFVMQPQSKGRELRRFLWENDFEIVQEALAAEGRRLYSVISARGLGGANASQSAEKNMFLFSDKLREDPLFWAFLDMQKKKYRRIAAGRAMGPGGAGEAAEVLAMLETTENRLDVQEGI